MEEDSTPLETLLDLIENKAATAADRLDELRPRRASGRGLTNKIADRLEGVGFDRPFS